MLFYRGRQRILDTAGNPVSGALANFYVSGTTTRADTYQDAGLALAHANPVVADVNGFLPPIYLDPKVEYKSVITNSSGAALPDGSVDPVGIGEVFYPRTDAEAAAGVTPSFYFYCPTPRIDARRYGVEGGLGTDQTTAINKAIAVAAQRDSAIIQLPSGDIYANITLSGVRGVVFEGQGRDVTNLKNYGNSPIFTINNTIGDCKHLVFAGMRIINRNKATYPNADAFYITGNGTNENDFMEFKSLEVVDMRYAWNYNKRAVWHSFEDVHAYSCVDGFHVDTTDNISAFSFRQVRFGSNTGYGMYIRKATGDLLSSWTFDCLTLEKNGLNGLRVSGASSGIGGWVFNGLYMEENTTSIPASATSPRKASIYIDATYCIGLVLNGPQLFGMPSGSQIDWHIYMDAACTNASGVIVAPRWGVAATIGAYTLTQGFAVLSEFGSVGAAVASRSANLVFNDYLSSSGSFTPALKFGGAATGITYSNQIGRYLRLSANVYKFWLYISLTSKGSAIGTATVTGLPIASLNLTNLNQPVTIRGDQLAASADVLQGYVGQNSTTIMLERFFDGVKTALTNSDFGNFSALAISGEIVLF